MLLKILEHLKGYTFEYLLLLIVVFGFGWQGSEIANAWASQKIEEIVATEVAEEAGPLKAQVGQVQRDMDLLKDGLNDLRARSLKREILEIRTLLCYSPGDRRLIQSYEDAQELYIDLTGMRFDPPPCDVLRKPS